MRNNGIVSENIHIKGEYIWLREKIPEKKRKNPKVRKIKNPSPKKEVSLRLQGNNYFKFLEL